MRLVLFGYQTWGYRTLRALIDSGHEVALVVTHPQSEHAYERIWSDSVAELATGHGIEVLYRQRPEDEELLTRLADVEPDLIVANNWRTWIPPRIFELPHHGTLNVHDSLLPAYGGFSPVVWALINGEEKVGVTGHMMDAELDTGPIVTQRSVRVGDRDTATDLVHKTIDLIEPVVAESLEKITSGHTDWTVQDRDQASFFHKRSVADSEIDWRWQAEEIDRLVRAQSDPYPNAYTFHNGVRLRVTRAQVSRARYGGTPGRLVMREGEGAVVVAGADAHRGRNHGLVIERVRTDDDTEHAATDFFRAMSGYLGRG